MVSTIPASKKRLGVDSKARQRANSRAAFFGKSKSLVRQSPINMTAKDTGIKNRIVRQKNRRLPRLGINKKRPR